MEPRIGRSDPLVPLFAFVASIIGLVAIWDAGYSRVSSSFGPIPREFVYQLGYFIVAVVLGGIASRLPGKFWVKAAPWGAVLAIAMLALVLTPLGKEIGGAKRWIAVGPFTAQPAEFAKLACVLLLAVVATRPGRQERGDKNRKDKKWFERADEMLGRYGWKAFTVAVILACFALFEFESDLGTAAVMAFGLFAVLIMSRAPAWLLCGLAACACIGGVLLVKHESYRSDRFINFEHRWEPGIVNGAGFQTTESEYANARGSLTGVGFSAGVVKKSIPAPTTDFLLATVAEEFGLLGVTVCIALIAAVSIRLAWRGLNSSNLLSGAVSAGLGVWIGVQAVTNVLMVNGHLPPIGIPLPFLSYGGTSLVAIWVGIGICESLATSPAVSNEAEAIETGRDGRWDGRTRLSGA